MARPLKRGLDYFPIDCNMDNQMELLETETGLEGFAIIIKLWQWIYSDKGYYIKWDEDTQLLFCKRVGVDLDKIKQVVDVALKRGIFNIDKYKKYNILTSCGIQVRFLSATRKRKDVEMIREYLTINGIDEETIVVVELMTEETELMTEETKLSQEESTQSKGEYSRVKNNNKKIISGDINSQIKERNFSPEIECAIKDWLSYKQEKNQPYKPTGFKNFLTQTEKQISRYGETAVVNIISESMANNYQGVVWEKLEKLSKQKLSGKREPSSLQEMIEGGEFD